MLEKYKDLLSKAKSAKLETLTAWYSFFRMREDPFVSLISPKEMEYFVNREDVVEAIIYDVGVASRGIPITTLIVGPFGSGKTAILYYVDNILRKLREEYPEEYSFTGELLPSWTIFEKKPEESEEGAEDVQLWVKISKNSRDFLLVDDAKSTHVKSIMREFTKTKLKVFAISPLDYDEIYSSLQVTPKTHFLYPFDVKATEEMLNKRIKRALVDENSKVTIFDLFDGDALKIIHKYSMGVPHLILKCASTSLKLLQDIHRRGPTLSIVGKQKVTSDIAARACKVTKCFHAFTGFESVSQTKMEVLRQILDDGKTPTEISSLLKKDRTTVSRHLSDLRKSGLVDFTARGRESVYRATEAVKVRFEIESMPKGGWNLASA